MATFKEWFDAVWLDETHMKKRTIGGFARKLENFQNFLVALEGGNQIGASKFRARPGKHLAGDLESAVARGGSGGFHGLQQRLRNYDAGHFVVQPQRLLVTV